MNLSRTMHIAFLVIILVIPGCAITKQLATRFEKPTFTSTGFELVETTQSGAVVNFLFTAHNANEAGLKNITCSYELLVEGKRLMTGEHIPLLLDPKGDTKIAIPATIAYADLVPVLGSIVRRIVSGQKTIPITIHAVFSGNPAIFSEAGKDRLIFFENRLTKTAEIPLPRPSKKINMGQ